MRLNDFKSLRKYIGKDKFIYILTDGLKFDPITERRKLLISLIESLPKDKYVRMNCNVSKKGTPNLTTMQNNGNANSIVVKHSVLVPLLEKNNLSLDILLGKKDILMKTKDEVNKQCLRKNERIKNKEATSQSWEKRTRDELLKKSTKYEKMVFKKLKSAFGNRLKPQHMFIIDGKIYFADMSIKSKKLIIEVDGGYHDIKEQKKKDAIRDKAFESIGYKTIRIPNEKACDKEFLQYLVQSIKDGNV